MGLANSEELPWARWGVFTPAIPLAGWEAATMGADGWPERGPDDVSGAQAER